MPAHDSLRHEHADRLDPHRNGDALDGQRAQSHAESDQHDHHRRVVIGRAGAIPMRARQSNTPANR